MNDLFVNQSSVPVLVLKGVRRHYVQGKAIIDVLRGIDLSVGQGEMIALVGPSGAGKSTLLHVTGLLEAPDEGEVFLNGAPSSDMDDNTRTKMRREYLGFVYQNHNLQPEFSALENVMIPQMIAGVKKREAAEYAAFLLEKMGLRDRIKHRPAQLSGGEAQRVAIARAYVNHPQILLADEPTGNLDPTTSLGIMEVLDAINRTGTTIVMATHNEEIVNSMRKRVVELHTGKIVRDEQQGSYDSALYFPDAEVESKSHQALGTSDPNAKYRRQNAIDSTNAPDDTVDVEGATRAETVVNAVDVVAAAVHDGQGNDGIARLAKSVHSGRTGRYGEAFASVETTLTWGKGLSLEQMADQEQAEQTERNEQAKTSAENDASETGADEVSALSAPPAPPVPPTQTEPPTPPEPPVPPAPSDENPEDTKEHD